MKAFNRLLRQLRHRRYLRQARAAIARCERDLGRRRRIATPGYDELRNPAFLAVMAGALLALGFDLGGGLEASRLLGLLSRAIALAGGAA